MDVKRRSETPSQYLADSGLGFHCTRSNIYQCSASESDGRCTMHFYMCVTFAKGEIALLQVFNASELGGRSTMHEEWVIFANGLSSSP